MEAGLQQCQVVMITPQAEQTLQSAHIIPIVIINPFPYLKYFQDSLDLSTTLPVGGGPAYLRSSLPDMSKPVKTYPFELLQTTSKQLPEDVSYQFLYSNNN